MADEKPPDVRIEGDRVVITLPYYGQENTPEERGWLLQAKDNGGLEISLSADFALALAGNIYNTVEVEDPTWQEMPNEPIEIYPKPDRYDPIRYE